MKRAFQAFGTSIVFFLPTVLLGEGEEAKKPPGKAEDSVARPDRPDQPKPADPSLGGLEADPKDTGAIAGRITLKGKAPPSKAHAIPAEHKDRPICGDEVPDERIILGPQDSLANVVVSLEKVPGSARAAPRTITLDNVKCRFVPHVQAATAGSTIHITTQDRGVLHSAMALTPPGFNVSVSSPEQPVEKKLTRPGWIPIQCAVHSWMLAHVWVFPHDFFAVTGKEGKFRIRGIPPGKYQVKVWHEALEEAKQEISVEPGKTADLDLELKPFEN